MRLRAERELSTERHLALPLLKQAAHLPDSALRTIRIAVLLHRMQEREGVDLLRRMVRDPVHRAGPYTVLLRRTVNEIVGPEPFLSQATSALILLEQRPESFKAIGRFRQSAEVLRFLRVPMPIEMLRRSLVVRTVGGENLSLVRAVLEETVGVSVEHVCMIRKEAAHNLALLHAPETAYSLLERTLSHPNPAVKLTAMFGLEILSDPRAVSPLHALTIAEGSPVREDAWRLIERLCRGTSDALTLLRSSTDQPETLLRPSPGVEQDQAAVLLRPPNGRNADATP